MLLKTITMPVNRQIISFFTFYRLNNLANNLEKWADVQLNLLKMKKNYCIL